MKAVKTAFFFAMCTHCQQHKTPYRATQSKRANTTPTTPQTKPHNQQRRSTGNRSEASRSAETTGNPQNAAKAQEQRRKPERRHHRSEGKPNKASEPPKPCRLLIGTH